MIAFVSNALQQIAQPADRMSFGNTILGTDIIAAIGFDLNAPSFMDKNVHFVYATGKTVSATVMIYIPPSMRDTDVTITDVTVTDPNAVDIPLPPADFGNNAYRNDAFSAGGQPWMENTRLPRRSAMRRRLRIQSR